MKGLRGNFELIIIGAFIVLFLVWAMSKCNSTKAKLQEKAAIEAKEDSIANAKSEKPALPPPIAVTPTAQDSTVKTISSPAKPATQPAEQQSPQGSKLYVVIDKLKIRKTPGLKGEPLGELKLYDEVYYQDEVTDSLYTLSLGKEKATEPYVKVKTKRGTVGWVYGAGVHYIKKKRAGVLE
jgi:hypothetical protein